jgi:hypothetical protein
MMFCSAARQGGFRIFRSAHTGSPCRIRVLLVNCNKALEKRRVVADLRCVKRTGCMRSVGETSAAREYIYGVSQGSIEPRSGILDGACSRGGRGIRRLRRRHRRAELLLFEPLRWWQRWRRRRPLARRRPRGAVDGAHGPGPPRHPDPRSVFASARFTGGMDVCGVWTRAVFPFRRSKANSNW